MELERVRGKILSLGMIANAVKHSTLLIYRVHNCSKSVVTDKIEDDVEKASLYCLA